MINVKLKYDNYRKVSEALIAAEVRLDMEALDARGMGRNVRADGFAEVHAQVVAALDIMRQAFRDEVAR